MFTMNLVKQAHNDEDLARVDRYIKSHCPVTHGFMIGEKTRRISLP